VIGSSISKLVDLNINTGWYSLFNIYTGDGTYKGSSYIHDINKKGEWLKYELPFIILLYKFTFFSPQGRPISFYIIGSNNNSTWVELLFTGSYSGNKYTGQITNPNTLYKYYAIVINRTDQSGGGYGVYLTDFRLYGTIY
jgi:hypothetical protein